MFAQDIRRQWLQRFDPMHEAMLGFGVQSILDAMNVDFQTPWLAEGEASAQRFVGERKKRKRWKLVVLGLVVAVVVWWAYALYKKNNPEPRERPRRSTPNR
jgi:hypothetical protein